MGLVWQKTGEGQGRPGNTALCRGKRGPAPPRSEAGEARWRPVGGQLRSQQRVFVSNPKIPNSLWA